MDDSFKSWPVQDILISARFSLLYRYPWSDLDLRVAPILYRVGRLTSSSGDVLPLRVLPVS